eukprot:scaffold1402_cov254-Pinguiococcus_pyrenoidosus.AAC.27
MPYATRGLRLDSSPSAAQVLFNIAEQADPCKIWPPVLTASGAKSGVPQPSSTRSWAVVEATRHCPPTEDSAGAELCPPTS